MKRLENLRIKRQRGRPRETWRRTINKGFETWTYEDGWRQKTELLEGDGLITLFSTRRDWKEHEDERIVVQSIKKKKWSFEFVSIAWSLFRAIATLQTPL